MGLPQQSVTAWRAALEYNLIRLLAQVAPSHADSQIFFSNSGAEAIESAIKFVKAYRPNAKYLINFTRAYHGKTYGALSLTPNEEYQGLFQPLMPNVKTVNFGDIDAFLNTVDELGVNNVAAVVFEPIQGEAGVIIPPVEFLQTIGELCQRHGILTVSDEIQVGLGRSGFHFASIEWGRLEPDIITLAKPLGGGIVPIGATIARKDIYHRMLGGLASKRHSNTFGGNSLAMAVGLRSLELILSENLAERARQSGKKGLTRLKQIKERHPHLLEDVRGIGLLFALQFRPVAGINILGGYKDLINELCGLSGLLALHKAGVHANLSLSSRRTVRLTPALTMPDELQNQMFDRVESAADVNHGAWEMIRHTSLKTLTGLARLELSE